jgi:hypothetical protein
MWVEVARGLHSEVDGRVMERIASAIGVRR